MTTHVCVVHRTGTRHVHEATDQVGVFKQSLCGHVPKEPHYHNFPMLTDCLKCSRISKMLIDKSIRANPTYTHLHKEER